MSQEQRKRCGGCGCSSNGQCVKTILKNGVKMNIGCKYSDIVCESCLGCKEYKAPENWQNTHTYIRKSQEIAPPTTKAQTTQSSNKLDVKNNEVNCSIFHNNIGKCGSYSECNFCKIYGENKCISNTMKSTLEKVDVLDSYSCYPKNYYVSNSTKLNTSKGLNSFDYKEYINRKVEEAKQKESSVQRTQQKDENEISNSNGNDNPNFVFVNNSNVQSKQLKYKVNNKGYYDKHMNSEITYVDEEKEQDQEQEIEENNEPDAPLKNENVSNTAKVNNVKTKEDIGYTLPDIENNTFLIALLLVIVILLFYGVLAYLFKKYN
jgi:hypothetical protein